ncbi:MAG: hypothetical protein LAO79_08555 [Acidobacteriia bacterium]|nr:hypothetical protein [Terriglobia bacterium]
MKSAFVKIATAALAITALYAQPASSSPANANSEKKAGITGAFEGWFKNPDGTFTLLLGYFNRDDKQAIDIPVGADNRIEPGGPDRGQPTHFLPLRQWGMFGVKVPADFGQKKINWTITSNGKTSMIPASLHPDYEISPFHEEAVGNTPPQLGFDEAGPAVQGPLGLTISRTTTVANPLSLTVFVSDDEKWTTLSGARPRNLGTPVSIHWTKYRGKGDVTFSPDRPMVERIEPKDGAKFSGKATVAVKFSEPGDYVLHVVANDYSGDGGGGEQCCWTFADVKVAVKP